MTRDDIIRMAREAGIETHERKQQARLGVDSHLSVDSTDKLSRFADLVSTTEREACAKVCNSMFDLRGANDDHKYMADKCAEAIRARSQQPGVTS